MQRECRVPEPLVEPSRVVARVRWGRRLELAPPLVPVLGAEDAARLLTGAAEGVAHDRSGLLGDLGDVEVEEDLARFGLPSGGAVIDDDPAPFRGDVQPRET